MDFGQQVLRRLEIVDSRAHVITAIELLSPSNKADFDAVLSWRRKRNDYLRGGINLVEIDLLRGGGWTLPDRSLLKPVPLGRVCYYVCVTRPPWVTRHEFFEFFALQYVKVLSVREEILAAKSRKEILLAVFLRSLRLFAAIPSSSDLVAVPPRCVLSRPINCSI